MKESEPFDQRAEFIMELARRLHLAGVSSTTLEGAVQTTARSIGVAVEIWSAPTGLLMSLGEGGDVKDMSKTRVLRLEPANMDLTALVKLDDTADQVIAGRITLAEAWERMRALDHPKPASARWVDVGAFGLAAAAVTALFRTGWVDIAVAGPLGILIGVIATGANRNVHMKPAAEAIAALVATFLATAFSHFVTPISVQTVVVASLIVLMPGLTLTTAVGELAAQQLVTGTTRFAGAVTTLLKLAFGSIAASQLTNVLGWERGAPTPMHLSFGVEMVALIAAAYALATLFHTPRRDLLLVMGSAAMGYLITRAGNEWLDLGGGGTFAGAVFFASMVMASLANVYGRVKGRPGALIRVPGIMLLVPGSAGFRGLASVMERNYALGLDTAVAVLSALIALVAGLLFGSLLVPPRRYL